MGQDAALGTASGARCVDDGGDRVRGDSCTARFERLVGHIDAVDLERLDDGIVEYPDAGALRDVYRNLVEHLLVLVALEEHRDRVRVGEDPLDLFG